MLGFPHQPQCARYGEDLSGTALVNTSLICTCKQPIPDVLHRMQENRYAFHCPGCECGHQVSVHGSKMENGAGWQWNGSMDKPTFQPSILVRATEITDKGRAEYDAWCRGETTMPTKLDSRQTVCHSFVRDGMIQFLSDCTHSLAGQTVVLPPWE